MKLAIGITLLVVGALVCAVGALSNAGALFGPLGTVPVIGGYTVAVVGATIIAMLAI